jgi:RimJ/RimL family protein N-acetyltransferase
LRVLETNSRARLLYEAGGFEVEGVLHGEFMLAGRYVDDLLMARDLTRD